MSEKGKLKPEVAPLFGAEMPSVIPPFSAKFRMSCMVGRKAVDIARKSTTEVLFVPLAMNDGRDVRN
jgi:hypothetical protein